MATELPFVERTSTLAWSLLSFQMLLSCPCAYPGSSPLHPSEMVIYAILVSPLFWGLVLAFLLLSTDQLPAYVADVEYLVVWYPQINLSVFLALSICLFFCRNFRIKLYQSKTKQSNTKTAYFRNTLASVVERQVLFPLCPLGCAAVCRPSTRPGSCHSVRSEGSATLVQLLQQQETRVPWGGGSSSKDECSRVWSLHVQPVVATMVICQWLAHESPPQGAGEPRSNPPATVITVSLV